MFCKKKISDSYVVVWGIDKGDTETGLDRGYIENFEAVPGRSTYYWLVTSTTLQD